MCIFISEIVLFIYVVYCKNFLSCERNLGYNEVNL